MIRLNAKSNSSAFEWPRGARSGRGRGRLETFSKILGAHFKWRTFCQECIHRSAFTLTTLPFSTPATAATRTKPRIRRLSLGGVERFLLGGGGPPAPGAACHAGTLSAPALAPFMEPGNFANGESRGGERWEV